MSNSIEALASLKSCVTLEKYTEATFWLGYLARLGEEAENRTAVELSAALARKLITQVRLKGERLEIITLEGQVQAAFGRRG